MITLRTGRAVATAGAIVAVLSCGDAVAPTPPEGVQAVALTPELDTLVSLQDTVHLTGVARDHAGVVISGATFNWSSTDTTVATVNSVGIVTAVKNGSARISATANSKSDSVTIVVRQRAATLEVTTGDAQAGSVGAPLDTTLSALVKDAGGSPAEGIAVAFAPLAGAGSVTPAQGTTDVAGLTSAQWTLGTTPGLQRLLVTIADNAALLDTLHATAFAGDPDTMFVVGGASQAELPALPLPAPLQVKVVDSYGNPIAEVPIVFSVTAGGGTLDSTEVFTDLDGVATARWTLGPAMGMQTVQAILPDSAVGAIVDLPGSPVTFTATAVAFTVTGVAATPVVGDTAVILGSGFDPVATNNTVTIGGVAALVTGVSQAQSQLHVLVPSFACTPAQSREIHVTRGAITHQISTTVRPAAALSLSVGQHALLTDPAAFCLQFLPGGDEEYVVGLTSTRPVNGELSFSMFATGAGGGGGGAGANVAPSPLDQPVAVVSGDVATGAPADRALRDWEAGFFRTLGTRTAGAALRAPVSRRASAVGDLVPVRIPDITTDACNNFTTISARVIAEGPRVTLASDATLPADPASQMQLAAAIAAFQTSFGATIYEIATAHFGLPMDLDGNQRIMVVLSPAVAGLPVFTSAIDHVAPGVCPASNGGEVVFAHVTAAPSAADLAALLAASLPALTHELAHLIQLSRRIGAGGFPLPYWLAEGQAMLGTELAGLAIRGDAPRVDYGASVVNADASSALWYDPLFDNMANLFGWTGSANVGADGTARCSVFGFAGITTPCTGNFARGAAWSFMRFVSDRMASTYATGEAGFLRDLLATRPGGDPVAVLEELADRTLDELLVQWAMALYVDGRVAAAAAPLLQLSTWNLADIFASRPAEERLAPVPLTFTSFTRAAAVVGGGTFYTRITNGAAHGAMALRVADELGTALGDELRPRLWVVRIR